MDRRTALTLLGAGVLANRLEAMQHAMHTLAQKPTSYTLAFFNEEQDKLIDRVADLIIPTDEHSAGAHAAHVSYYIDLIVANSPADTQTEWQLGLSALDDFAREKDGKPFLQLSPADQNAVLAALAPGLKNPSNAAEQCFASVRKLSIAGYYTSKIGLLDDLGYKGNQALGSYPGCQIEPRQ
jgi:hypothetical protein